MNKLNRNALLITALIGSTFGLTNCSSTTPTPAKNGNVAVVTNSGSTEVVKTEQPAGDKIGVPECDDYIAKYEACVTGKVPEAQRGMFKSSMETMRKTWKDAAATPQGRAGLAAGCKQATDAAKQSMSAFSCAW